MSQKTVKMIHYRHWRVVVKGAKIRGFKIVFYFQATDTFVAEKRLQRMMSFNF